PREARGPQPPQAPVRDGLPWPDDHVEQQGEREEHGRRDDDESRDRIRHHGASRPPAHVDEGPQRGRQPQQHEIGQGDREPDPDDGFGGDVAGGLAELVEELIHPVGRSSPRLVPSRQPKANHGSAICARDARTGEMPLRESRKTSRHPLSSGEAPGADALAMYSQQGGEARVRAEDAPTAIDPTPPGSILGGLGPVIDRLPEAILVTDRSGAVRLANVAADRLFAERPVRSESDLLSRLEAVPSADGGILDRTGRPRAQPEPG